MTTQKNLILVAIILSAGLHGIFFQLIKKDQHNNTAIKTSSVELIMQPKSEVAKPNPVAVKPVSVASKAISQSTAVKAVNFDKPSLSVRKNLASTKNSQNNLHLKSKDRIPSSKIHHKKPLADNKEPVVIAQTAPKETAPQYKSPNLSNIWPTYPYLARQRGIEGKVMVRVQITEQGKIKDLFIIDPSGSRLLDMAAIKAIRNWQFIPARLNNKNKSSTIDIPIIFRLKG